MHAYIHTYGEAQEPEAYQERPEVIRVEHRSEKYQRYATLRYPNA